MNDNDFKAAGCDVGLSPDGQLVRVRFYDSQERGAAAWMERSQIPMLLAQLSSKIGAGTVRPINPREEMGLGKEVTVIGNGTRRLPGGGVEWTVMLEVAEGEVRTLAFDYPPAELRTLIAELKTFL